QPPHAAHSAPGRPGSGGPPTAGRAPGSRGGGRGRIVVATAVAVVLGGGGITYAMTGGHGGKGGGQASAAQPQTSRAPSVPQDSKPAKPNKDGGKAGKSPGPKPAQSGRTGGADPQPSAPPTAEPGPVPTSCTGWSHQDRNPGSYGYMAGSYHITTGPYQSCPAVAMAKSGTKLQLQCYVVNAYGTKWTYVRSAGTAASGWMSNDNLTRQSGPLTRC
ncbi:hypothetical protein OV450_3199, partial [Actinobacteria bacterium OV450]